MESSNLTLYEFFAGGGLARIGLGSDWTCTFANEWCAKKASAYRAYFGPSGELREADIRSVKTSDLPGTPDLVWASFPCQDLSLAGSGAGLKGERSGTFAPFWQLMRGLIKEGRSPHVVAIENVVGTITSHHGKDFETILRLLCASGYRVGAMVIDAVRFVPQSRPRLFIIAADKSIPIPTRLSSQWPSIAWYPRSVINAYAAFPKEIRNRWIWWSLPEPTELVLKMSKLIEKEPSGVKWHNRRETQSLLAMMTDVHKQKVKEARAAGKLTIGTVYKRTRPLKNGGKAQRAEVRFDEIAGCLRTPVGGSSRQTVLIVDGKNVNSRLLSPREVARLMGAPESYPIPENYNDSYHLFGDAVVVPVVRWLEQHLLKPLALAARNDQFRADVA
jgi:DNA (cytosine-5)-methyltransferase 1